MAIRDTGYHLAKTELGRLFGRCSELGHAAHEAAKQSSTPWHTALKEEAQAELEEMCRRVRQDIEKYITRIVEETKDTAVLPFRTR